MRTSLNEIQQIENHLFNKLTNEEEVLFQVKLLLNDDLPENLRSQKKAYEVIQAYGRKQIMQELESAHRKLFSSPEHRSFRNKILNLFRR